MCVDICGGTESVCHCQILLPVIWYFSDNDTMFNDVEFEKIMDIHVCVCVYTYFKIGNYWKGGK